MGAMNPLIVDCGSCQVRGASCSDCVITVLLAPAGDARLVPHEFSPDEQDAVLALSGSGLVPPLRLVEPGPADRAADEPLSERRALG